MIASKPRDTIGSVTACKCPGSRWQGVYRVSRDLHPDRDYETGSSDNEGQRGARISRTMGTRAHGAATRSCPRPARRRAPRPARPPPPGDVPASVSSSPPPGRSPTRCVRARLDQADAYDEPRAAFRRPAIAELPSLTRSRTRPRRGASRSSTTRQRTAWMSRASSVDAVSGLGTTPGTARSPTRPSRTPPPSPRHSRERSATTPRRRRVARPATPSSSFFAK